MTHHWVAQLLSPSDVTCNGSSYDTHLKVDDAVAILVISSEDVVSKFAGVSLWEKWFIHGLEFLFGHLSRWAVLVEFLEEISDFWPWEGRLFLEIIQLGRCQLLSGIVAHGAASTRQLWLIIPGIMFISDECNALLCCWVNFLVSIPYAFSFSCMIHNQGKAKIPAEIIGPQSPQASFICSPERRFVTYLLHESRMTRECFRHSFASGDFPDPHSCVKTH